MLLDLTFPCPKCGEFTVAEDTFTDVDIYGELEERQESFCTTCGWQESIEGWDVQSKDTDRQ